MNEAEIKAKIKLLVDKNIITKVSFCQRPTFEINL
jgi:hypothetical protein